MNLLKHIKENFTILFKNKAILTAAAVDSLFIIVVFLLFVNNLTKDDSTVTKIVIIIFAFVIYSFILTAKLYIVKNAVQGKELSKSKLKQSVKTYSSRLLKKNFILMLMVSMLIVLVEFLIAMGSLYLLFAAVLLSFIAFTFLAIWDIIIVSDNDGVISSMIKSIKFTRLNFSVLLILNLFIQLFRINGTNINIDYLMVFEDLRINIINPPYFYILNIDQTYTLFAGVIFSILLNSLLYISFTRFYLSRR